MINPVLIERDTMTSIGNAIRNKGGATTPLTPGQMPAAINNISGGSVEPFIINGMSLAAGYSDAAPHNDWDKINSLIDYENAYELVGMFDSRADLKIREVEEFLSHRMSNIRSIRHMARYATYIDSDIATHVFDLTLDSPNCPDYSELFGRSSISHLKLTITEHNVDFNLNFICIECNQLQDIEIKGPGLNHVTSLSYFCTRSANLKTVTIGDDNTNYSKVSDTRNMFDECSNLKTLIIKGVNVLPLTSTNAIPSTIQSIKVPSGLVYNYKHSTNWTTFANKISAI